MPSSVPGSLNAAWSCHVDIVSVTDRTLAAARGLYERGQPADALAICDDILAAESEDARALHLSAAQAAADCLDATLLGLAAPDRSGRGFEPTLPGPLQMGCNAVLAFNEALAAEDHGRAASIIDALTKLFPSHVPVLENALRVNAVVGRQDRVAARS